MSTFNDQTFWKDGYEGVARGGIFIRAVELKKFLHQIEESETGGEIVGLRFDDNNLEVIVKPNNLHDVQYE